MIKFKTLIKGFISAFITAAVLTAASCSIFSNEDYESFPTGATAKELAGEIFTCFLKKDSETLKNHFSPYIQNTYDIDSQIEEAFTFIDGEILSYDEPKGEATGSRVEDGIWIERILCGEIKNIKTDKEQTYEIIIKYFAIEKNNPDKVGCSGILINNTTYTDDTGEMDKYIIGE